MKELVDIATIPVITEVHGVTTTEIGIMIGIVTVIDTQEEIIAKGNCDVKSKLQQCSCSVINN